MTLWEVCLSIKPSLLEEFCYNGYIHVVTEDTFSIPKKTTKCEVCVLPLLANWTVAKQEAKHWLAEITSNS
jgi:hypothetical protein